MAGKEQIVGTLKAAREAKGLSQRALASRVGLPQSHISKIESGGVNIRLGSLIELARVLDLELELIPRKAVPAVESIVRQTAPSIERDQQSRVREALRKAGAIAERFIDLDRSQSLYQIGDAAHLLEHLPVPAEDLRSIQNALKALHPLGTLTFDTNEAEDIEAVIESPKVQQGLKSAARTLQNIRNRAVHHPPTDHKRPRPAHDLSEEDENG